MKDRLTCDRSTRSGSATRPGSSFGRPLVVAFAVSCLAACGGIDATPAHRAADLDSTEILWDRYGVPHIFARTDDELSYAFGWAQARSHGELLLRLYGTARGRAAEYWGERHLESDRLLRTVGVYERAEEWYEAQPAAFRERLDAFAAGVNDALERYPEVASEDARRVLPVTGTDLLAHGHRVVHLVFLSWGVEATVARWQGAERASADAGLAPAAKWAEGGRAGAFALPGSNAWAIGPSRSASGHALLLANPHLPWEGLFTWFEAELVSPSLDAYGAALVGLPFLAMGFNDRLGWTHTVNTLDASDLYELRLEGDGYRWDGGVRAFEAREDTLWARRADGRLDPVPLTIRRSVHGPVVAERGDRALALRMAGLEAAGMFEQYWDMTAATGLEEFEAALSRLQMPMFTVIYADADGHILHLFGGRVPVRPEGPWDWAGIVRGDTSASVWTETHPYEDLPRVVDPESGWLQNANDPPWTTTFPEALDPDDFPPYMAPRHMSFRPQRSARMLAERKRIDFEELVRAKHSTRSELADRLVDDLVRAARAEGDDAARRAADALEGWDRKMEAESRGAVLFDAFARAWFGSASPAALFARRWDPAEPLDTPSGVADPAGAAAALSRAAAELERRHGRLDVAWGEIHRLVRDTLDLPGHGGPDPFGIFRAVGYAEGEDGRRLAAGGDSWVAAIEFSTPVRAEVLLAYGNQSVPGSPHRTDQLEAFARQQLRPAWRDRAEVERNLSERERLPVSGNHARSEWTRY